MHSPGTVPHHVRNGILHSVVSNFFVTPWTVARQAPLYMGFSRKEYWTTLHFIFVENNKLAT